MARKPTLTAEDLKGLGPDKLVDLVLAGAARDGGFSRLVKAALAGRSVAEAIARLVDRRLSGLQKARSFVDWDRAQVFRDDLQATVDMIAGELASSAPVLALDRLLRFIATHEVVFERVDDSSGAVQAVYYAAIEAVGAVSGRLDASGADLVPDQVMAALGGSSHGYLLDVGQAIAGNLPQMALARWETDLAGDQLDCATSGDPYDFGIDQIRDLRQIIALARGDLDLYVALEDQKKPHVQDTLAVAERFLAAGRSEEALDWICREGRGSWDRTRGAGAARLGLQARILTALGRMEEAQLLRWQGFEQTLDADLLRDHVKALPDFAEFEVMDRAFAHALVYGDNRTALTFLMGWPRHDLAARLIISRRADWDGSDYYLLPTIAEALERDFPLAATILYRALLDDILRKARSKAYPHAARYLKQLGCLAGGADADPLRPDGFADHAAYQADLAQKHARKTGFWANVKGR